MKANGIRKVVASPGSTNITLVTSMQHDPFFEIYSCVDERSAAYMACGMAAESGEPVVISCTGATAPRNYFPALTEAYYRKLPIVAITATQDLANVGQLIPQVTDRSLRPKDVVVCSEHLQFIEAKSDEWNVTLKVNRALRALKKNGGGPVHLNLETRYSKDFSVRKLPETRVIKYIDYNTPFIDLPKGRIGIFVGSHKPMEEELTRAIDSFCASYNAVVLCDQTSNYKGKYRTFHSLIAAQDDYVSELLRFDLLINIGEMSGNYVQMGKILSKQQWRVCEDGETRDPFRNLTAVFEMSELAFFAHYSSLATENSDSLLKAFKKEYKTCLEQFPEIPFSNIWMAHQLASRLPKYSRLHVAILNSLRSWNFFEVDPSIYGFANTGGFGIEGGISSVVGASLISPNNLFFCIVGDLAFFYDLNSMGNRHIGNNLRILLVNNGRGGEFRIPYTVSYQLGSETDEYIAAARHFGNKSRDLVKHYAQDLGYEYLSASNKEEFKAVIERFVDPNITDHSIIFEAFTDVEGENSAIWAAHHILCDKSFVAKRKLKAAIKSLLPDCAIQKIKKILGK